MTPKLINGALSRIPQAIPAHPKEEETNFEPAVPVDSNRESSFVAGALRNTAVHDAKHALMKAAMQDRGSNDMQNWHQGNVEEKYENSFTASEPELNFETRSSPGANAKDLPENCEGKFAVGKNRYNKMNKTMRSPATSATKPDQATEMSTKLHDRAEESRNTMLQRESHAGATFDLERKPIPFYLAGAIPDTTKPKGQTKSGWNQRKTNASSSATRFWNNRSRRSSHTWNAAADKWVAPVAHFDYGYSGAATYASHVPANAPAGDMNQCPKRLHNHPQPMPSCMPR